jgi:Domain of unknown function (DUF6089)
MQRSSFRSVPLGMCRFTAILLVCAGFFQPVAAQVSEIGLTAGAAYYIGDLNPTRHYPVGTQPAVGFFYRYNFNQHYAFRLQGLYTHLQAFDSDSNDSLQLLRNLGFRTVLFEVAATFEINFLKYRGLGKDTKNWTPYMFFGLAYFHMNPQNKLNDTWYDLQPLGTEGQGSTVGGAPYNLDVISIPFGFGFKFALTDKWDLGLEWGLRRTYTDHLDDVSGNYVDNAQLTFETGPLTAALADPSPLRPTGINTGRARGDGYTRDWYQYTGISLSMLLSRFTECDAIWDRMKNK